MIAALQAKDDGVRVKAATALWSISREAKEAVPALTAALKDKNAQVRLCAAGALGEIGPDARDAIPALAHRITLRPEMWLRRIDPGTVVAEVLSRTAAPVSGALPTYAAAPAHVAGPRADPYRYTAPPRG